MQGVQQEELFNVSQFRVAWFGVAGGPEGSGVVRCRPPFSTSGN